MTVAELFDIATKGGIIGLLVVIVVGGMRKWYVWWWQYHELVVDRNFWRDMALSGGQLAEKATSMAERVVRSGPP